MKAQNLRPPVRNAHSVMRPSANEGRLGQISINWLGKVYIFYMTIIYYILEIEEALHLTLLIQDGEH